MERKEYDIVVTVNDREVRGKVHAETTLLEFLRQTNHRDVKHGCDHGDCGALYSYPEWRRGSLVPDLGFQGRRRQGVYGKFPRCLG